MKTKIFTTAVSATLIGLTLAGCTNNPVKTDEPKNLQDGQDAAQVTLADKTVSDALTDSARVDDQNIEDPILKISLTDPSDTQLTTFEASNLGMIIPGKGVFYMKDNNYYLLRQKDGQYESIPFKVPEGISYETTYSRIYLNGKIYTLVTTGDLFDNQKDTLWLLGFDPESGECDPIKISENGFPYSGLTVKDGKIIVFFHDQEDILHDRIVEYDPSSGDTKEIMTFSLENELKGDTVRSIYALDNKFYVLRLHFEDNINTSMFVDVFDSGFKKISEYNITDPLGSAVASCIATDDKGQLANEFAQSVSKFLIFEGRYLYYQNFSVTTCFIDLEESKVLYSIPEPFTCSIGDGEPVFYCIFNDDSVKDLIDPDCAYRFKDGKLIKIPAVTVEDSRDVNLISSSSDGNFLIVRSSDEKFSYISKIFSQED